MKLKKKVQEAIDNEDTKTMSQYGGGSDGFWYDLILGGYFKPEDILADKKELKKVQDAIQVVCELEEIYDTLTGEM